jgi:hypothetical protein
MKKSGTISQDGEIQSTIQHYHDDNSSIARITVDFKGKSGTMVFQASEENVDLVFESEGHKINANELNVNASQRAAITSNSILVDAEEELLLNSAGRLSVQAIGGILNLVSSGDLNIGSNGSIEINALLDMLINVVTQLELFATQIRLRGLVSVGTGIFPVARVGDQITLTSANSGVIVGPGSATLFTD